VNGGIRLEGRTDPSLRDRALVIDTFNPIAVE
jgi:hypothetical protein